MAKYIQDMTLGEVSQMVQSYLEQSEKATVVFVKTVGIGGDSFDVNTREEDGREYQLLMVEATLDGANYGIGIEWSPELGGIFGHWKAPQKKLLAMNGEEAQLLKGTLHAVYKTWRRYPGMNNGKSEVYDLYPQDLDTIIKIHDKL